ncbi:hypothetical protein CGCSCA4_v012811 [Colletotrichum siamense]|uniref:Uncharacterized protein n=1 Tax=Colletotrichum siamense TaxID=690259 RepID=A0A9P5BQD1_COLSI|nr:hypothetical protein CGCSCA4_v012811 [Colletotrichum siamense]KAF4848216.1 hypothetical protein CGCSCA2_v012444 [Colletotrichum siamense]
MSFSSQEMNESSYSTGIITPTSPSNMTDIYFHPDSTFFSSHNPTNTKEDEDACMDSSLDQNNKDDDCGRPPVNQSLRITHANYAMIPEFNVRFLWVNQVEESWAETQKSFLWEASLYVQARDVGQLMHEGFYLSTDQEIKGTGCIAQNVCPGEPNYGDWKHTRHYIFKDPDMKWTAHLHVCASQMAELARFRLTDLKPSKLVFSWGYNPEGFHVYGYSLFNPKDNFNTIYEDVPLEGIWPWPKEKRIRPSNPAGTPRINGDINQKGMEKPYVGCPFEAYNGVPPLLRPGWQPQPQSGFTCLYPRPPPFVPKE